MPTLLPKPPPMSGETIRILCSGIPATMANSVRWACGAWVVSYSVSLPLTASKSATAPQVSMGAGCTRGYTISWETTTSAAANTASVSAASPISQSKIRLSVRPSMSSRITGASGSSACRASTTGGSTSYSTSISSRASRAA
ncbi:hypothetical protein AHiyo6_16480 [Arthrobacter sp. Hiyo6]|nr:hypothetical protein AHiyo6_16480 [Arthrobacter sp. Hiyo6]